MTTQPASTMLPLVLGVAGLILVSLIAIAVGAVPIAPGDVMQAALGHGDIAVVSIVRDLRAPRVALAALVGAALGMSGGALQGTLRNQLAEPYLLGVSGGAAVGAVLLMSLHVTDPVLVTAGAFLGAATAAALVTGIARVVGGSGDTRLLLMAGVVVGAFANAAILVALADAPPDRLRGALWWMMGSAAGASWQAVLRIAIATVLLGGVLLWRAREIDVLVLGDEPAAALGVDVDRASRRIFLVASLLAAATVASAGLIGFIGLVVPNLARALGAQRHRGMLLVAAVYGALLLVAADLVARTVRAPADLPLGAVTALIGVPFFLTRLRKVVL
ncbi:MAG TPA: iron ABC transporter permease [Gemmatimonas sp.]|nr:iron ABC transporter permease [Gemmatimonas sp.]